jgi:hypothetical protein
MSLVFASGFRAVLSAEIRVAPVLIAEMIS